MSCFSEVHAARHQRSLGRVDHVSANSVAPSGLAGDARRVAALEVWDESAVPWWSQLRRRLRDDPGVWSLLERALGEHPATSGRLTGLRPLRPARTFSTWLAGTWHPDGTDVLVKVNATRRERFWMSAASHEAPDIVPHVFASDDALGPVDASWLVLERLPYIHHPGWGAAAFSSLLTAAARFQVFAATTDTDLVFDEDVETIRRFALGGQDLCPEAATVISHLDGDWAWVEAVAPREVLFGDLHFGNAAFRSPRPDPAVLYDPVPRREPWPFEPAYLEVLCNGSGLVREMAAIRRAQGRAVCEPDEVDRLSTLFCGWLALAFWSMLLDWHADPAQRTRLAQYVSAAAYLERLGVICGRGPLVTPQTRRRWGGWCGPGRRAGSTAGCRVRAARALSPALISVSLTSVTSALTCPDEG